MSKQFGNARRLMMVVSSIPSADALMTRSGGGGLEYASCASNRWIAVGQRWSREVWSISGLES